MRIGIDARLWEQTGVGRYIRNLVLNLQQIDKTNEYVLFVRSEDASNLKSLASIRRSGQISNPKFKIIETDIKWHSLAEQVEFPKILNKENLDLVHFPYFSVPVFYNKPYIVTIHDLIINHFSTGKASTLFYPVFLLKREGYKYIIKHAAKNAKKIIAPSVATKNEIIDHLKVNKDKIVVTLEAADLAISHQPLAISQKYGQYFLYVGNAYPHKNLERLIKAFNNLQDPRPKTQDLKLILVGNKDYFYQNLEKENKADNIIFYGKASDTELASLYKNAIALVLPSLMEGFGLPVLEAMLNKCLVLCSDIPSFKEVAGENVVYFDPENSDDISEKLKLVINDKTLKTKLVEKAEKHAKEFSWERMAAETLKVYEETLRSL